MLRLVCGVRPFGLGCLTQKMRFELAVVPGRRRGGNCAIFYNSTAQSSGRIQKKKSPILDSNALMVYITEPEGGSIFWILPGPWGST